MRPSGENPDAKPLGFGLDPSETRMCSIHGSNPLTSGVVNVEVPNTWKNQTMTGLRTNESASHVGRNACSKQKKTSSSGHEP